MSPPGHYPTSKKITFLISQTYIGFSCFELYVREIAQVALLIEYLDFFAQRYISESYSYCVVQLKFVLGFHIASTVTGQHNVSILELMDT